MAEPLEAVYKKLKKENLKVFVAPQRLLKHNLGAAAQSLQDILFTSGFALTDANNVAAMQGKISGRMSREFLNSVNMVAMSSPERYWHIYEPGHVGETRFRLFDFEPSKNVFKSVMRMEIRFRGSKLLSPVHPKIGRASGDKNYVKRRHKFPAKAIVFEFGQPIVINRRSAKKLVFYSKELDGPMFIDGPVKINTADQATMGALTSHAEWFVDNRGKVITEEVYGNRGEVMAVLSRVALRRKITVKKRSSAQIKAQARALVNKSGK